MINDYKPVKTYSIGDKTRGSSSATPSNTAGFTEADIRAIRESTVDPAIAALYLNNSKKFDMQLTTREIMEGLKSGIIPPEVARKYLKK